MQDNKSRDRKNTINGIKNTKEDILIAYLLQQSISRLAAESFRKP